MKRSRVGKAIFALLLIVFTLISASSVTLSTTNDTFNIVGAINYAPRVDLTVNPDRIIGSNNLSLGFMLDWHRWQGFIANSARRELAQEANFKLVRVFDFRATTPRLMPCTYWNETTKTGKWNWTNVDILVQKIFEIGAEPLFCLGWARDNIQNYLPLGMAVDTNTSLPYPDSFALYATEWVKHFKGLGLPVKYYQIMNEPNFYFGFNPSDTTKLSKYVELWNITARSMRKENPSILLSQDCITMRNVFDYWLGHGDNVDFLDFHKYDADTVNQYDEATMFTRAETRQFETSTSFYGVDEARQRWFNARGKWIPAINSESNFNSASDTGTDPKIQQMSGAVWLALVLRMGVLKGLSYSVYFELCSSKSWQQSHGTGWGFGMTNEDNNQPWYPYFVQKLIGENLSVGDSLVETSSSSTDIRTLAWIHAGKLNVLVASKVTQARGLRITGADGNFAVSFIDGTVSYDNPRLQTDDLRSGELFPTQGYTVAMFQLV